MKGYVCMCDVVTVFFSFLFSCCCCCFFTYTGSIKNGTTLSMVDINIKRLRWRRWRQKKNKNKYAVKSHKRIFDVNRFPHRSRTLFSFDLCVSFLPLCSCYFVWFNSLLTGFFFHHFIFCVFLYFFFALLLNYSIVWHQFDWLFFNNINKMLYYRCVCVVYHRQENDISLSKFFSFLAHQKKRRRRRK